jgi:hypothetical protein
MKMSKRLICTSLTTLALAASAWAGGTQRAANEAEEDPWIAIAVKIHSPAKEHGPAKVVNGVGKVVETFLHWPRIFAEIGDRKLVSKKGILALPETPIEEQIYSPRD